MSVTRADTHTVTRRQMRTKSLKIPVWVGRAHVSTLINRYFISTTVSLSWSETVINFHTLSR